jgi:hypothetical protein
MAGNPQCLPGQTIEGVDTSAQIAAKGGLLAQVLGAWPGRGRHALRGCRGAGSEGSTMACAGKGGWREYEGSARDVTGKKKCAMAHRDGQVSMRRQSQGWMVAF